MDTIGDKEMKKVRKKKEERLIPKNDRLELEKKTPVKKTADDRVLDLINKKFKQWN